MPMNHPPHPGGFLLRQCIEPMGLSITQAAAALGRYADHPIGTGERKRRARERTGESRHSALHPPSARAFGAPVLE